MALIAVVESQNEANILICEVDSYADADIRVYVEESEKMAQDRDEVWCYIDTYTLATSKVCWVDSPALADLLIYFVDSKYSAGWQRVHRFQGQL